MLEQNVEVKRGLDEWEVKEGEEQILNKRNKISKSRKY